MGKLRSSNAFGVAFVFCIATISSYAQTFDTITTFNGADGASPWNGALVQGLDGNLYGTTINGGSSSGCGTSGCGTFFKITPSGMLTSLYSFCSQSGCVDGEIPYVGVIQTAGSNFYGAAAFGGASQACSSDGCGTIFKVTTSGVLTTLHSFNGVDGFGPEATLVKGANGNFYGTTVFGGTFCPGNSGCGTVFEITPSGTLTKLHDFDNTDGDNPSGLILGRDGNFYGTTSNGGPAGGGTVFKITSGGALTTLYNFCLQSGCTDGRAPFASLVQATDGNFYGTTQFGGNSAACSNGCGTVFRITPSGVLTTLHNFDLTDGEYPNAALVQATDGNLYGTTRSGGTGCGSVGCGTVFAITPSGTLTTLHRFDDQTDGDAPSAALLQYTDGTFYGTTEFGVGNGGSGTVFNLSLGLGPFVKTAPTSGKVGASIVVLGNNLKGATSVSFNGTSAAYKVVSRTEITTVVPNGATTGPIKVTTPSNGTLSSYPPFYVTPQIKSFKPASGPVGTQVNITGVSLSQTTVVRFGGVAASGFTVQSDTAVTATVPAGAATGKISITTAGGAATSAGNFQVTK